MAITFIIDTNFFISGFSTSPRAYKEFNDVLQNLEIQIQVTDFVIDEMRWYMRRSIEPLIEVVKTDNAKLSSFCTSAQNKVDIQLPQLPDMSLSYLNSINNNPIVSSDWRLVEVSQKLGQTAMMNSAFLLSLIEKATNKQDSNILSKLHEKIFADEITYSVESKGRYDPVVRIQKIMDSALDVIRNQSPNAEPPQTSQNEIHDFQEYIELKNFVKIVRTDISYYIDMINEGKYNQLNFELNEIVNRLTDLITEVRMQIFTEDDLIYKEALTTLAHILLLKSTIAIGEHRLSDAQSFIDQLFIIMLENSEVEDRLDIEVHLQRITIFLLTEQINRLKIYFTPSFIELCIKRNRQDILELHRILSIIMTIITTKSVEEAAIAKSSNEIEFVLQLAVQFISVGKLEIAWLLLHQSIILSQNANEDTHIRSIIEILLPLSFSDNMKFEPDFNTILSSASSTFKSIQLSDYQIKNQPIDTQKLIIDPSKYLDISEFNPIFQEFLDVISSSEISFKTIGNAILVKTIEWEKKLIIGILDPSLQIDQNLKVGTSIKIHSGQFKLVKSSPSMKQSRNIDLLLIPKSMDVKFIIRRVGQLNVTDSRVLEFDL